MTTATARSIPARWIGGASRCCGSTGSGRTTSTSRSNTCRRRSARSSPKWVARCSPPCRRPSGATGSRRAAPSSTSWAAPAWGTIPRRRCSTGGARRTTARTCSWPTAGRSCRRRTRTRPGPSSRSRCGRATTSRTRGKRGHCDGGQSDGRTVGRDKPSGRGAPARSRSAGRRVLVGAGIGAGGRGVGAPGARSGRAVRAEDLHRPRVGDGAPARGPDHPAGRPFGERHGRGCPRVHGLHARRHRLAQEGQGRALGGRRLLQQLPRPHGLGLLLEQAGRAGSAVHRQHLRPRVERVSPRSADEARRELRLMDNGKRMMSQRLGIGIVGSGFNARFHVQAFVGVRDADVLGIWSPNRAHAEETAALAGRLDVGQAKAFPSVAAMVADPRIDAIWLCGPNHARIENVEEIADAVTRGKATLKGIACEKPLARNVAEAKRVAELTKRAGLAHGYLENQRFAPPVEAGHALLWARGAKLTGRPYLARAAEEHSGPHMPWFWQGKLQGGGVLNDMMCHSSLVVRHLLTKPGAPLGSVRPARVTGHIASLKWSRHVYAKRLQQQMGKDVDYTKAPSEDFASVVIEF